ncbi:MAG TPA: zf-TFIIB domain-containing protein [Thermoanaerobaculia bacterium]|nr:zf-TFIIB domain-containing protein [Thermoanaerobaculia bacterium]
MTTEKPSKAEDEYFTKMELERKRTWEQERSEKMALEERQKLKDLHFMKCPKCGMDLHEFELHGISLDRCVSCEGTWFDSGEVEQLIQGHDKGLLSRVMSVFK